MDAKSFSNLPLKQALIDNVNELGFSQMTAIQEESLPPILEGKDVLAQAKTGSGKTAAFGLGLLNKLDVKQFKTQALILCPTRELADQVAKELRRLARFQHNIKILILCGGMPFGPQLGSLRHGAHIVVGTPGRILKHISKDSLSLDAMNTLVLDEADRMLDMGFIEDIQKVISSTPPTRQTLLFSATYPDEILSLSQSIQNDAITIKTLTQESTNNITEEFYGVEQGQKLNTFIKILSTHTPHNVIVFSNTKIEADSFAKSLRAKSIDALAIHGDLEQFERNDVLTQFSNSSCSVLVATDVAARGLDIKDLAMVINLDLPNDISTYTHRIGRTARAGKTGLAFTFYRSFDDVSEYQSDSRTFFDSCELEENSNLRMTPPNITMVIEGGKKDKIRAGDILGALTGEVGLEGKYIGKIDIFDRQSYVAIDRNHIKEAHKQLKEGKIKGKRFSTWILE